MLSFSNISVDFQTGVPALVWLALVGLLVLTFILYRRTNPPVPPWIKILLGALRVIAVIALIAVLLEPIISYSNEYLRKPRIALLLDDSRSMDREEGSLTRAERVDSLLATDVFDWLADSVNLSTYYFAEGLAGDPDQLSREKTALGEAIYELQQQRIVEPADQWLLISDGKSNAGRQPQAVVQGFQTPVVTVDVAQDVGNFDVRLAEVDFNPVTFVGQSTEIQARIGWHNAANRDVIIELRSKGRPLTQGRFSIDEESGLGDVTLEYIPA